MKKNLVYVCSGTLIILAGLYLIFWNINEKNYLSEKTRCINYAKERNEKWEKGLEKLGDGYAAKWKYSKGEKICYYIEQITSIGSGDNLIVSKYIYNLETNETLFMSIISGQKVMAGLSKEEMESLEEKIFSSH